MCHGFIKMEGEMSWSGGFFGIDSEVWDVHLGEDIVDVFGLPKGHKSMVCDGEGIVVVSCVEVFYEGFVDFMVTFCEVPE